ncbi:MAG: hypothetical protein ROR55_21155 [Devosia sp.]
MSAPALVASAALVAVIVAGCSHSPRPATVAGECRIFTPAPHAVRAQTRVGQRWVDTTIETGVRNCGHRRPPPFPD